MTPEEIATTVFDQWYVDAASFTGPTARRECIAAIADTIRAALAAQRERDAMVASARAFKWREILDQHPDDAMANQRWREACDIGTLIRQY